MDSPGEAAGLCETCRHARRIANRRGSAFVLCEKAATEPALYARYPRLPVRLCPGYMATDATPEPRH